MQKLSGTLTPHGASGLSLGPSPDRFQGEFHTESFTCHALLTTVLGAEETSEFTAHKVSLYVRTLTASYSTEYNDLDPGHASDGWQQEAETKKTKKQNQ